MASKCSSSRCTVTVAAIVVAVTLRLHICLAFDVYFPTTSVKFKLPLNEESESIFSKIPLAQFQVLRLDNNQPATDYIYSLEDNPLLRLNTSSGEVYMRNDYQAINESVKYVLTAFPRSQNETEADQLLQQVAHLTLELEPQPLNDYCAELEHICFWTSAHYTIAESSSPLAKSDSESFQPVLVGALNSRAAKYLCAHHSIEYALKAGSAHFLLKQNRLYTKQSLDHDELNGLQALAGVLQATVSCTVKISAQEQRQFWRSYNVTLLDRNDNGPRLQERQPHFNFYLEQPYFKMDEPVGEKIIYLDKDTLAANAHLAYTILNDALGLVRPDCHAFEADHTGRPHTIVSCQLRFSRSGVLRQTPYCVDLMARDLTIQAKNVTTTATAHVCLHVDTDQLHESDQPRPQALPLRQRQHRIFDSTGEVLHSDLAGRRRISIDYEKDVFVHRSAASYYRVAQPESFLELMRQRSWRFALVEDRSNAFGITEVAGILYVRDGLALERAPETIYFLNVTWQDPDKQAHVFVVNVHLIEGRPANASCEVRLKSRSQTCAQVKYRKQCGNFCGVATNGGPCMWRGSSSAMFGRNYGSCVPDARYCPDQVCDALEELNPFACPQDCTRSDYIMGPHTSNGRGILSGSGTCICEDNGKCSCGPLPDEDEMKPKRQRKRKNETETESFSAMPAQEQDQSALTEGVLHVAGMECNRYCILVVISCPLLFVLLLLCLLLSQRKLWQRRLGKQSATPASKQVLPHSLDALGGDLPLMPLQSGFKFESADAKWEFPREQLQLDTVLGEGEFGQVLKGYATQIAGLPGVTTVAVKMLKKGANSVEYMALLSEFQLLQEVSHPNVIKLLGACTQSDAPLLIIEYARYGSLRSYLRLSRKIECAGVDFSDGVEPVNVKMMLTFAWQICKGMSYLTELKLVHRDLAARNVLLADGKICKISDFGLTRDVYEDDAYLKRSRDRVPVKWMAPESLADHVYTSKSDVWAFGVLCWELITLGASPYPGIAPQNLWSLLKTGYRMERPENCSEAVYSVVRTCWADEANARPSFKYLAAEFEKLLGNNAKYIELETNAVSNPFYCSDEAALMPTIDQIEQLGEPESLQHLWSPPKMNLYDMQDQSTSRDDSTTGIQTPSVAAMVVPPGYDLPRPLIDARTTEQVLRYENDLRFPLNIRKSSCAPSYSNMTNGSPATALPHYAVPVKRGRSYLDMTNNTLIPDNLDNRDFEKHLSKTISFRFSSLLNLKEPESPNEHAEDAV
ncbi:proto-oncogene tyrosine-protein kinase receptor Ret isoform X1 [Drosophila nasuta]|uniref:proto-oncogene tyrosine-protein kinase receptor Ret isoform X1 n=2 Tax=Drosophila nasuta TaxID=42062 RepID=UPI00295F5B26|nr:proto-oncogene tyrosine-protein kinase receptor Ret isoform X1 [Drosophila nasuta]